MNPIEASQLYRQAVQGFQSKVNSTETNIAEESNFLNLVKDISKDSIESLEGAEKLSIQASAGKAELADVAVAVAHAESTLKTVVTVRDKMIGAYQEIMRMPI